MKRPRPLTALLAVLAFAFAQLAVAAHPCSKLDRASQGEAAAHPPCHGSLSPEEQPVDDALCAEHCQQGNASVDSGQPCPAAVDQAGPVLRVEVADPFAPGDPSAAWRYIPAAAPPPPAILFGVLRI